MALPEFPLTPINKILTEKTGTTVQIYHESDPVDPISRRAFSHVALLDNSLDCEAELLDAQYSQSGTLDDAVKAFFKQKGLNFNDQLWLPIYASNSGSDGYNVVHYDFNAHWWDGFVGIIYSSKAKVREHFGIKKVDSSVKYKTNQHYIRYIGMIKDYLNGQVFQVNILKKGQWIDGMDSVYPDEIDSKVTKLLKRQKEIACA